MKLKKRIFSLLMMLCMVVTLMPTTFIATETGSEIESGTLTYVWNFAEADETVINDMTVSLNYCNSEQEVTGGVTFVQSTSGYGTCEVTYVGDKFVYEGQEYSYIRLDFALPEGYVINTQNGVQVTNSVSFMDLATLKEIQDVKVHTQVDKLVVESGTLTFTYQCVEMETGDMGESLPGDVIQDATMEAYFTQMGSNGEYLTDEEVLFATGGCEGTVAVSYVGDKFLYNGKEYDYVMFLGVFSDEYKTGHVRTVAQLKEDQHSTQYFYPNIQNPDISNPDVEINTKILVKFMHGNAILNAPCKNTEVQSVELGSQQYIITVDEEDISANVNGQLYLTTTLAEMFPDGIPEAPDHEIAGNFLGWYDTFSVKGNPENTLEDYCYKPDEELKLPIQEDNSISFIPVYDRKQEGFYVSYIDEMGNQINNQMFITYVDFPITFGEKLDKAKEIAETFGLKHVGSFGEITASAKAAYPEDMYPLLIMYGGTAAGVTYTYEYNRTDTTFDKTEYTFGLEDGTVVDGVKVKVSLCKSMNDTDKVTIETSTSGQGDVVIEHIDDVIYYGGDTYEWVEVEYVFPEGYVIKDTDNTGTTVWYTATEWCAGGGTYWLLEKLPEPEPEVEIIIPDEEAPAEEEVKVKVPVEKPVVSEEKMDDIIEANKKHPVKIETNDDVIIEFPAGGMKPVEGKHDYDFGVKIEKDYDKAHDKDHHGGQHVDKDRKFKEDEFVLRINYNYSGELPGEAEITIPVGKEWAGKTLYYYQLMEDGSYRYTGQHGVVDEHGNFRVKQGHCSDYVVVTQAPEEEGTAAHYTALMQWIAALNGDTSTVVSPKTGDTNGMMYVMLLAAASACVVLIKNKRKA